MLKEEEKRKELLHTLETLFTETRLQDFLEGLEKFHMNGAEKESLERKLYLGKI